MTDPTAEHIAGEGAGPWGALGAVVVYAVQCGALPRLTAASVPEARDAADRLLRALGVHPAGPDPAGPDPAGPDVAAWTHPRLQRRPEGGQQ
jgi:hypothetical protein